MAGGRRWPATGTIKSSTRPNDVVVARDGSIYFTDPSYGRQAPHGPQRDQELDFQGLHRITPDGALDLLADDFDQPNGLCFSPAQDRFYVNDTVRRDIRSFRVRQDGSLSAAEVFLDGIGHGQDDDAPDGIWVTCDKDARSSTT